MSTLISNTTIITMTDLGIIENGAIGWSDDTIDFLGKNSNADKSNYDTVIDGTDRIILPGLINAHFHSSSTLLKGLAQDVPELEWMNKALGPFIPFMTDEDQILGSKLAVIEGLRTGTTTFAEYTTNVSQLIDAVYDQIGGRVAAAENINEIVSDKTRQGPNELYNLEYEAGNEAFKRNLNLIKKSQDTDLITPLFGPQALDMVTQERLSLIHEKALDLDISIHMHVAQGQRERLQIEQRYGSDKSTIDVLDDMGFLSPRLIAAHCHDTTSIERTKMYENDVGMVSCQSSIGMIDGKVPPLYEYSQLGGKVGIGTDQVTGVGHSNLFREMRTGAQFAKIKFHDPTVLPPWQMLRHATIEGAKVLGIDDQIGSLEKGKKADIITIDKNSMSINPLTTIPIRNIIPNLVYSASGYEVNSIIINGELVMEDKQIYGVDTEKLVSQGRSRSKELVDDAHDNWREVNSMMVDYVDRNLL